MNEVEAGGYSSLVIDGSEWEKAGGTWGTGTSVLERVRGQKKNGFWGFRFYCGQLRILFQEEAAMGTWRVH